MAKKQTRRSISVSRELYLSAQEYAAANNVSLSGLVESMLRDRLGMRPNPVYTRLAASVALESSESQEAPPPPTQGVAPAIEAPKVQPRPEIVSALRNVKPPREVKTPCRREGCSWVGVHEAGSCL